MSQLRGLWLDLKTFLTHPARPDGQAETRVRSGLLTPHRISLYREDHFWDRGVRPERYCEAMSFSAGNDGEVRRLILPLDQSRTAGRAGVVPRQAGLVVVGRVARGGSKEALKCHLFLPETNPTLRQGPILTSTAAPSVPR